MEKLLIHLSETEFRQIIREEILSCLNAHPLYKQQDDEPLKIDEAREFVRLDNVQTLYRMVRENRIPYHKKASRLYFFKSELSEWLKNGNKVNS